MIVSKPICKTTLLPNSILPFALYTIDYYQGNMPYYSLHICPYYNSLSKYIVRDHSFQCDCYTDKNQNC